MPSVKFFVIVVIGMIVNAIPLLYAEELLLRDGGAIRGTLLNPEATPRINYDIKTESGIRISLPNSVIEKMRSDDKPELTEYVFFAPQQYDTVEAQMMLTEWCRERRLMDKVRIHATRIVELDPENGDARTMLRQTKIDGVWTTQKAWFEEMGYVRARDGWRTPQEEEIEKRADDSKKAQLLWSKELEKMRKSLIDDPSFREKIASIRASAAVPPLIEMLRTERNADVRILYIRALSSIGNYAAISALAGWSVGPEESVDEVRLTCFDEINKHPEAIPVVSRYYASLLVPNAKSLSPAENKLESIRINRAAAALGKVNAKAMVPELIDALETTHQWKYTVGGEGQYNAGPSGMAAGTAVRSGATSIKNQEVLNTLVQFTGQNFLFDQAKWRQWLIQSRKTPTFDARRG